MVDEFQELEILAQIWGFERFWSPRTHHFGGSWLWRRRSAANFRTDDLSESHQIKCEKCATIIIIAISI